MPHMRKEVLARNDELPVLIATVGMDWVGNGGDDESDDGSELENENEMQETDDENESEAENDQNDENMAPPDHI